MIFGLTQTICSHVINWMLKKTVQALRGHPLARVKFPTREKMREYAAMVQWREPLMSNIIGFMDVIFKIEYFQYGIDSPKGLDKLRGTLRIESVFKGQFVDRSDVIKYGSHGRRHVQVVIQGCFKPVLYVVQQLIEFGIQRRARFNLNE